MTLKTSRRSEKDKSGIQWNWKQKIIKTKRLVVLKSQ